MKKTGTGRRAKISPDRASPGAALIATGSREHGPGLWVEVPVGKEWVACYRIAPQEGQPIVAGVLIVPATANLDHQLSRFELPADAVIPRGGLTTRRLRQVHISKHYRRFLQDARREHPGIFERRGFALPEASPPTVPTPTPLRRGRKGRPDSFYAKLAREYVLKSEAGSLRPVAEIAGRRRLPQKTVSEMIHQARKRDLLTAALGPGQGRGELTDKARAILEQS